MGTKLIKWLLEGCEAFPWKRPAVDMGLPRFICSFGKFLLYLILIFNIATNFGVKESSVAALLGTAGVTIGLALAGACCGECVWRLLCCFGLSLSGRRLYYTGSGWWNGGNRI